MKLQALPDIEIIEERSEQAELEPLFKVIIHNDNVTPFAMMLRLAMPPGERQFQSQIDNRQSTIHMVIFFVPACERTAPVDRRMSGLFEWRWVRCPCAGTIARGPGPARRYAR